jgi:hypothetical protein
VTGIIACDTIMAEVAFKEEVNVTLLTDCLGPHGRHPLMAVIRGIVSSPGSHRFSPALVGR